VFFFPNPRKTRIQLLLEAQQHKKYAQTTDDGVSSLLYSISIKGLKLSCVLFFFSSFLFSSYIVDAGRIFSGAVLVLSLNFI
jgi:hypothetical protein